VSRTDSEVVRRAASVLLLAFALVGCQGSDAGFYDGQAKDEALRAAKGGPFKGRGSFEDVSVGRVVERDECPQAPSPEAGPCLNVAVTAAGEAVDLAGKEVGLKVQSEWDFFVWLEKRKDGRWKVTHSTYRPKGVAVNGQEYIPNQ
jgi:hypothetical protein